MNLIPKKTFFFVRHGRTDWSTTDIMLGPMDNPLNEFGIQDASNAASLFASMKYKYNIVSSTLLRAHQTAQIIANKLGMDIQYMSELKERYYGDFRLLGPNVVPIDAECEVDFKDRVLSSVIHILQNTDQDSIPVIVAHGLVFKELCRLMGYDFENINYGEIIKFVPDTCTWMIVRGVQ